MTGSKRYGKYYKFLVYLAVVVLINIVGTTLFFRADLTSDRMYSLSEASKKAVSKLSEPLTINVFFTENLPAPHNNTERYLRDLIEEYSIHSNRYFNYRFYNVSAEEGDLDEDAKRNQEMARNYGIYPVQIQDIEQDEVKFQRAYMGMVMIHGDVVEKIPTITSTEGLEYTITSKIEKMNAKISTLLNMEEPVQVRLYFSSTLGDVAPQLRMDNLMQVPARVEALIDELNTKYYGKLAFSRLDPSVDSSLDRQISAYNIVTLRWPSMKDRAGKEVVAEGRGSAAIVVEKGEKFETIPLIQVINVPLFGTQYQLADMERMKEKLGEVIDDVIDINKKIGYLSDHGTLPLYSAPAMPNQPQQQQNLANFNRLVSQDYSISPVQLRDEGIPDGIDCLIIAGPKEQFSDYELFQIDQFLMKGKSLALFLDPYQEYNMPQGQNQMNRQGPMYLPINTGLEKLINHYGATTEKAYVLDKKCFEQRLPQMYGGGSRPIYFAPVIGEENINRDMPFMKSIKSLVTIMSSPVGLLEDTVRENSLRGDLLYSSSDEAWLMSGRINLNPMMMRPPDDPAEMESRPMALLVQGEFPSFFAGKEIPEKPAEEEAPVEGEVEQEVQEEQDQASQITGEGAIIEIGKYGKLFLGGSSQILGNNVLDEEGRTPNATFVMNLVDYLNGRDEYAEMRSKMQRFNPLRETEPGMKAFVKSFNIAGLPVIVAAFGVIVWMRRSARKKRIELMFNK
jgi:ABC-type uncharacterized transport system involved in gliding motility auxiliary subunit